MGATTDASRDGRQICPNSRTYDRDARKGTKRYSTVVSPMIPVQTHDIKLQHLTQKPIPSSVNADREDTSPPPRLSDHKSGSNLAYPDTRALPIEILRPRNLRVRRDFIPPGSRAPQNPPDLPNPVCDFVGGNLSKSQTAPSLRPVDNER